MKYLVTTALVSALFSGTASAQFASDIPGVPRAAISISGSSQHRTMWDFSGYRIPGATGQDTLGGGLRFGLGRSYRIQSQFEIGFDFTLLDAMAVQSPTPTGGTGTVTTSGSDQTYLRGITGYGLRLGAKYQPIVAVDPDGNGYAIAFGGGFQPQLRPLYGIEKRGDSTRSDGQFSHSTTVTPSRVFGQSPFSQLTATTLLAAMGSYRSKRLMGDAALMIEKGPDRAAGDPSPIQPVSGASLHAGGSFRLTPGFAVGGAYWGSGSSPWYDEVTVGTPGTVKPQNYAFLIQFGSNPESGVDLMYSAPNGQWGQSGRLYIRARSTQ